MTELTQDNLQEVVAANPLVFVQFGAGWCGNCKIMKPKFKKYASETADDIGEEIILGRIRHQDYVKLPLSVNEGLSWDRALK